MQIQGKYSNCGDTPTIPTRLKKSASHMTFFHIAFANLLKPRDSPCTSRDPGYEQVDARG